ncbi:hypothetical protein ACFXJ8_39800 [Nonomuraea sp. NPDC059194]
MTTAETVRAYREARFRGDVAAAATHLARVPPEYGRNGPRA